MSGNTRADFYDMPRAPDVILLKGNDNNNHDPRSLNGISLRNGKGGNSNNSCPDGRRRRIER
jgi:hypothetical protein